MRSHHFVLILVGITTCLLITQSAISGPRAKPAIQTVPESLPQIPWGGSS